MNCECARVDSPNVVAPPSSTLVLKKRETVCSEDFNLYYFYSKLLTWILAITLDATVILPNMSGSFGAWPNQPRGNNNVLSLIVALSNVCQTFISIWKSLAIKPNESRKSCWLWHYVMSTFDVAKGRLNCFC